MSLERFYAAAGIYEVPGQWLPWAEFLNLFQAYMTRVGRDASSWDEDKFRRALGPCFPIGRGPANVKAVGNLSREFRRPRVFVSNGKGGIRLESPHIVPKSSKPS